MDSILLYIGLFALNITLFTVWGMLTKQLTGTDWYYRFLSRLPILIPVLLFTIWGLTTPNETGQQVADNVLTAVFWLIYMIIFVLLPFIFGEIISSLIYNVFGYEP